MDTNRLIPRKTGDRLIVAAIAALLLQGIFALILTFIDLSPESGLSQPYGPVEVRFMEEEPAEVREFPRSEMPEETEEAEKSPQSEESVDAQDTRSSEDRVVEQEPRRTEEPPRAEESPQTEEPPRAEEQEAMSSPEKGRTEPAETEAGEAAGSGREEQKGSEPTSSESSHFAGTEQPDRGRSSENRKSETEAGQDRLPQESSEIVYGEEESSDSEEDARVSGSAEEKNQSAERDGEEESIFGDDVMGKIAEKESGGGEARGDSTGESKKDSKESSASTDQGASTTGESGVVGQDTSEAGEQDAQSADSSVDEAGMEVEVNTEGEGRELVYRSPPDLNEDLRASLPPEIRVRISFTLAPSGLISSLSIENGTGNTEVDARIRKAVRGWRFDPIEGEEEVSGSLIIVLRSR